MGRFCAAVLFLAACGDNLGPAIDEDTGIQLAPERTNLNGETVDVVPGSPLPGLCGSSTYSVSFDNPKDATIAVAGMHGIDGVFSVQRGTPGLSGFSFSNEMTLLSNPTLTVPTTFQALTASAIDSKAFAVGFDGSKISVEMFDLPIAQQSEIFTTNATTVGRVVQLGRDRVVAYGTDKGLAMMPFTDHWRPTTEVMVGVSKPVTSLSIAQNGTDEVLATWTTSDKQCFVQRIDKLVQGTPVGTPHACDNVQIAGEFGGKQARVIYTNADNELHYAAVSGTQLVEDRMVRPDVIAPKLAFDGIHYWVTYTNSRKQIVNGFFDDTDGGDGSLVSMALPDTFVDGSSFDMSVIDGGVPYVVTLDPINGFGANKLCVTR
ncbi:MAG: hypothetical protein QM831_29640 [Kofleriaceae bacterium]